MIYTQTCVNNGILYNIFKATVSQKITSSSFFAVKKNKMYRISGMFKSVKNKSFLYFGYAPYTKHKKFITPRSFNFLTNTGTELARPCSKGDTTLYIKNGWNWIADKPAYVAFDTDNSGDMSDLPNFSLAKIKIKGIKKNDNWKISLVKPCIKNYLKNTQIREHVSGAYEYIATCYAPDAWSKYSGIVTFKQKKLLPGEEFFLQEPAILKLIFLLIWDSLKKNCF